MSRLYLLCGPSFSDKTILCRQIVSVLGAEGVRPVLSESRFLGHLHSFEEPGEDEHPVRLATPRDVSAWLAGEAGQSS